MEGTFNLHEALKENFGFDSFKSNQEAIIRTLLSGKDVFVLMPTGGGKSMCYQLPALLMEGTAIVISPLIALMKNQVDAIRNTNREDGVAHFINSSLTKSQIEAVKEDIRKGTTKLLYVAPESLTKGENVEFLKSIKKLLIGEQIWISLILMYKVSEEILAKNILLLWDGLIVII